MQGRSNLDKGRRGHLVVVLEPCREYSVLGQADVFVLLHCLVQTVHPQIFQVNSIQKTLQVTIVQFASKQLMDELGPSIGACKSKYQWVTRDYLASIKDWSVACASAKVSIKSLLHLCRGACLTLAVCNRKGSVAGNNHSRSAEATLRAMKASNAFCTPNNWRQKAAVLLISARDCLDCCPPCTALKPVCALPSPSTVITEAPSRLPTGQRQELMHLAWIFPATATASCAVRADNLVGCTSTVTCSPVSLSTVCTCTEQAPHPPSPQPFLVPCRERTTCDSR